MGLHFLGLAGLLVEGLRVHGGLDEGALVMPARSAVDQFLYNWRDLIFYQFGPLILLADLFFFFYLMQGFLRHHQLLSERIALFQEALRYFVGIFPILLQFESRIFIILIGELEWLRGLWMVPREAPMDVVDILQLDAIVMH
jgi:hypothetical protein